MRRLRPIVAMLLAAAALTAVTPALAKGEDAVVTLDAGLPGDALPGTEVEFGWTVAIAEDDGSMQPFSAEGVFVRLLPSSGEPVEFVARQDRAGHYVATITVPNGGVGEIEIGLRGTACTADGRCQRADEMFNLSAAVAGAGVGAEAAPLPAGGGTTGTSPEPAAAPAIIPFLPLVPRRRRSCRRGRPGRPPRSRTEAGLARDPLLSLDRSRPRRRRCETVSRRHRRRRRARDR